MNYEHVIFYICPVYKAEFKLEKNFKNVYFSNLYLKNLNQHLKHGLRDDSQDSSVYKKKFIIKKCEGIFEVARPQKLLQIIKRDNNNILNSEEEKAVSKAISNKKYYGTLKKRSEFLLVTKNDLNDLLLNKKKS